MKSYKNLLIVAVAAAAVGAVSSTVVNSYINKSDSLFADTYISADKNLDNQSGAFFHTVSGRGIETDFTKAAESTVNAVVCIKSFVTPRQRQMNNFIDPFEFFFGPGNRQQQQAEPAEPQQRQAGLGSGVIISDDGYIVTNNHVIDGAERLEVLLNDNRTFNAKVIGTDPSTDIALLKIEASGLAPVQFGNSDDIKVGEWVLAVGNPFGFTSTVTTGIVSAKARSISSATHSQPVGVESFIQTDAAVNPGNSGGALVTTDGLLIGINTMIYSQTGNYAGYAFAVPSNIVQKVVTDIKQYGTVQRAVLGIMFTDLTSEIAKDKGITATHEGIYVSEVIDRSAAKEAGITSGDVITHINGSKVKDKGTMIEQMSKFRPGDKIKVSYIRDNKKYETSITLRNSQGNTEMTKRGEFIDLGCALNKLSDEKKKELQISRGVEVTAIKDGKFKNAGIKNGFVILTINDQPVDSSDDVEKIYQAINQSQSSKKVMWITGIYPTGKQAFYAVPLSD
ncbi:MAG: Do family serine endopeptidase [Muribaculaceae bacterium]|nr:Do family serine endopeptidase [Muribaculaceae bacterium]